jgi:hypothetical protein
MLGPGILLLSAPLALAESLRAVRVRGQRLLGGIALLVAFPAMAYVMLFLGVSCYVHLA